MSALPPAWADRLRALGPQPSSVSLHEKLRATLGALLAVLLTGAFTHFMPGHGQASAWLVAPMGASAVLLFVLPSSPMTQPWPVIAGSVISAGVGIAVARWLSEPHLAGALAVALALGAMWLARCLHPPGGALALLAVLTQTHDFGFALDPVLPNALLCVAAAVVYNNLTGKPYPHRPATLPTGPGQPSSGDIAAVLHQRDELVDVDPKDLQALVQDAQQKTFERTLGELRCQDIMSRSLVTARTDETLDAAWQRLRAHSIKALPVVDAQQQVRGILSRADFVARWHDGPTEPKGILVRDWMTRSVRVASAQTRLLDLLPLFSQSGHHHLPIVDQDQRLVGMVTQSDVVRALARNLVPPAH